MTKNVGVILVHINMTKNVGVILVHINMTKNVGVILYSSHVDSSAVKPGFEPRYLTSTTQVDTGNLYRFS